MPISPSRETHPSGFPATDLTDCTHGLRVIPSHEESTPHKVVRTYLRPTAQQLLDLAPISRHQINLKSPSSAHIMALLSAMPDYKYLNASIYPFGHRTDI
jgi:hypothetical protein